MNLAWNPWTSAEDAADLDAIVNAACPIITILVLVAAVVLAGLALGSWR